MNEKLHNGKVASQNAVKKFWAKKRNRWLTVLGAILLIIIVLIATHRPKSTIVTDTAIRGDLSRTVIATGTVISTTDLSLSFSASGIVSSIKTSVGAKVKKGATLAVLDQKRERAALTSAQATLLSAKANYQKLIDGSSNEQITLARQEITAAETTLANEKAKYQTIQKQQGTLVENARLALNNSGLAALPDPANTTSLVPTISGTYVGQAGTYHITITGSNSFKIDGLENSGGTISSVSPAPLGSRGLLIQFPAASYAWSNSWNVVIPNTSSPSYVTYYNAYQAALDTHDQALANQESAIASASSVLEQRKTSLNIIIAQARPADLSLAEASILSAQGSLQSAQANYQNTIIYAPTNGTITSIKPKVGEVVQTYAPVMTIQDIDNLYVEAYINEANIDSIRPDTSVDINFDALGVDRNFLGKVDHIDPASTVLSGVVNYKITVSLPKDPDIRPGMTANMTILVKKESGVLSVPARAVVEHDAGTFVRIITNDKKNTYKEVPVIVGLSADSGRTEIVSGLSEGDKVVVLLDDK